ncbi:MAG: MBL fold metallo-hydrolase [Leptospiraceae bacterium]|nr:MBL fold metallo-hydrolase [Leptospiraceae bacterium]
MQVVQEPPAAQPRRQETRVSLEVLRVGYCNHPECVAMRGGSLRSVEFPALVGLIRHPSRGYLLYDTGYAEHFFRATRKLPECLYARVTPVHLKPEETLLRQLADRGIQASDIDTICISHFHADHIAGLRDFPRARLLAMRAEVQTVRRMGRLQRLQRAFLQELLPLDLDERLEFVEDCAVLDPGPRLHPFQQAYDLLGDQSLLGIDLPGHTRSQLGLVGCDERLGSFFLIGDAAWSRRALQEDRKPMAITSLVFDNRRRYDQTFDQLAQLLSEPAAPHLIPSHCLATWQELFA